MCLGIPGRIESIAEEVEGDPLTRLGKVSFAGITRQVQLGFVPEAGVGDYVIVHVGVALSRVDPDEAERTLRFLESMGDL